MAEALHSTPLFLYGERSEIVLTPFEILRDRLVSVIKKVPSQIPVSAGVSPVVVAAP